MNAIRVRGSADPDEIAAVLAAVLGAAATGTGQPGRTPAAGYERWRDTRLQALRRLPRDGGGD